MIYMDNAATTFHKPESVRNSVIRAMKEYSSPGRGGYKYAMDAADMVLRCRERAAELFNAESPENVVFTFNATHALNIAINSLVSRGDYVVISGYEHNSVVRPLKALEANVSAAVSPLFKQDKILESFARKIEKKPKAVICNHISNVFGYILPVDKVAQLCHEHSVPLIIDASQSAGVMDIDVQKLKADFIAMPGHKGLYGPQGTGILLCTKGGKPLMHGGTGSNSLSYDMPNFLPDRLEAGTQNIPGIAGLLAGIDYIISNGTQKIFNHEQSLIAVLKAGLEEIRGIKAFTADDYSVQSGVMSFIVKGVPAERVGEMLGDMNIAVRTGLHCSPLAHKSAGTIRTGTVRASVSAFTRKKDIFSLLNALERIAENIK